jgi:hypothetical protein
MRAGAGFRLDGAATRKPLRPGLQDEPPDGERHAEVKQQGAQVRQ